MKSNPIHVLCFTSLAVIGGLFAVQAATAAGIAPRRPAKAFALYHGNMAPVVGADEQRPWVLSGEKEVRSDVPVAVAIGLGTEFAAGAVEVQADPVDGWVMYENGAVINPDAETINFRGNLTSDTDLEDVFVVVLIYNSQSDLSQPVRFYGTVSEVGKLQAGKKKGYHAATFAIKEPGTWFSTMLVFADGLEVPTNDESTIVAQHLDALDRATLAQKIEKRNGGPDAPLALERNFPVGLSEELRSAYDGQTVKVRLAIGADGNVDGVELAEVEDDALQAVLSEQLALWLFVPSVKDGKAVAQKVVLPLKF